MIKVVYHRELNRVTMEGHAKSGEVGHDLVCASASILIYTLASFVQNLKESGQARYNFVAIKEGDAIVSCQAPNKYKSAVTLVFDSICGGFELLARDYPENVTYEIRGKSI